jgi:hypothetical protein
MADPSSTRVDTADVLAVDDAVAAATGGGGFGVTDDGFVAKPFARLLAEKLALARALLGDDLDLSSGSAVRKLLEVTALEDARTWAALASVYDNSFISTATGEALSRLGEEVGLARPFLEAQGSIKLTLSGKLPSGYSQLSIPRGARLSTPGGHHVATDELVVLSPSSKVRQVTVLAFYPGAEHNLDPAVPAQKIDRWNRIDAKLSELVDAEAAAGATLVTIEHTTPLKGGELRWPDARYRALLLRAPRSVWTVAAIEAAVSLVPGVRQAVVRDGWGGLDIHQSVFGNFNFIERVFSSERDLGSPYYFTVLVAPTPAAVWDGPDGLRAALLSTIEDLRPIGIFPQVTPAVEVGVGVSAELIVTGLPLPAGSRAAVNQSAVAAALKARLLERLSRHIAGLKFGEPVRVSEVIWALMNEPGVADVRNLRLLRYTAGVGAFTFEAAPDFAAPHQSPLGQNINLQANQIAVFVDDSSHLSIV